MLLFLVLFLLFVIDFEPSLLLPIPCVHHVATISDCEDSEAVSICVYVVMYLLFPLL